MKKVTPQTNMTVFYSWQSDLPAETNHRGISSCIKSSLLKIEEKADNFKLIFDEATRNESGSPDIPLTIFNKISGSEIFICDVTTIDKETLKRKTPNPNVLIELGYAIAELGWERIIMLFNKDLGDFPNDLPFDLDKRRVVSYIIKNKTDKSGKGDLTSKLEIQIESIIKKNPAKPLHKKLKTTQEAQREKDIINLTNILSFVHIQTMDNFINGLPYKISERICFFQDSFDEIYQSSSFYLYDKETKKIVNAFIVLWRKTLSYFEHFSSASHSSKHYTFDIPFDRFPSKKAEKDFHQLFEDKEALNTEFRHLIEFIREKYLEIDLDAISEKAFKTYKDFEKEISK